MRITVLDYDQDQIQEYCVTSIDECPDFRARPTTTWINVVGVHRPEVIEKIGSCFDLHPLVLEDIVHTEQRPKMEDFDDYVFIVLKMLASVEIDDGRRRSGRSR